MIFRRLLLATLAVIGLVAPAEAAKLTLLKGSTSVFVDIFVQDSSSALGVGLTGLTSASGSLVCTYARSDQGNAGGTAITLQASTLGTYTSGMFKEKDASNMPGVYEFGIPNNALATGSDYVVIMCKGAANMAPMVLEIQLTTNSNGPTVMPEASYVKGATSVIHEIFIRDSVTNLGKTGLTNGSAGLTIAFGRADQGAAAYTTCAVQAATRGSYTSCGFVEKDATNAPGWYELGLTTTMLATGADYTTVSVYGVSGTMPTQLPIALVDIGLAAINSKLGTPVGASMSVDTAAVQTSATAIKAKTDLLGFTGSNVNAITNAYASGQTPVQPTVAGRTLDVAATGVVTAGATWRKNVAGQPKFPLFMRDSLVPSTPKTGLTLTVQVWKDAGTFGTATGTAEEIGVGWYAFSPSQADLNCNLCIFSVTSTGAIPTGYTINTAP